MTALLEKTYGIALLYGYSEDRHSISLRDDDGTEVNLYDLFADRVRLEVIEDYQSAGWLAWEHLTPPAQDRLLHQVEETLADPSLDASFAREAEQYTALDSFVAYTDLTSRAQLQVEEEVLRRWNAC